MEEKNAKKPIIKSVKKTASKSTAASKKKNTAIKRLKLLVTVVDRSKAIFYLDLLEGFEINMQTVVYGSGTANGNMLSYLGLVETDKAVIFSVVREDKVKAILETLEEKFEKVKNGKGIAFTVAMNSVIGVSVYSFLSNQKTKERPNAVGSGKGEKQ